ncbi:single-stranded DNA-binding protein [Schinkia azotoformans]|uniref:Single-stranded DNA-binding protein n=1 Tax=Schinkia azotoformans LMG 9581 TaxID=1131731 RepID=K6C9N5_SCHAZ|nr:single-stranded DNA-binding protein [Schinkia azotoformans]EKN67850.1 single-stranded DNA-binding protein [Schinkia azotoformans LMG 9581]MEC1637384.1 single-stranded DNA-binding protein [Schinkia azotoformans]MEC1943788.1 single-stranded DNA-binding protein [Schinkia azotoformans]
MLNRVVLVGRLTKDPELRFTPNGVACCNFTLAVNRTFANQQGEREADFINIVVWRKAAENVANFLKKGSLTGVDGRMQTRNYEGQDGKRIYITEIVAESVQFLEPKSSSSQQQQNNNNYGQKNNGNRPTSNNNSTNNYDHDPFKDDGLPIDISDDDLPF